MSVLTRASGQLSARATIASRNTQTPRLHSKKSGAPDKFNSTAKQSAILCTSWGCARPRAVVRANWRSTSQRSSNAQHACMEFPVLAHKNNLQAIVHPGTESIITVSCQGPAFRAIICRRFPIPGCSQRPGFVCLHCRSLIS